MYSPDSMVFVRAFQALSKRPRILRITEEVADEVVDAGAFGSPQQQFDAPREPDAGMILHSVILHFPGCCVRPHRQIALSPVLQIGLKLRRLPGFLVDHSAQRPHVPHVRQVIAPSHLQRFQLGKLLQRRKIGNQVAAVHGKGLQVCQLCQG